MIADIIENNTTRAPETQQSMAKRNPIRKAKAQRSRPRKRRANPKRTCQQEGRSNRVNEASKGANPGRDHGSHGLAPHTVRSFVSILGKRGEDRIIQEP